MEKSLQEYKTKNYKRERERERISNFAPATFCDESLKKR